MQCWTDISCMFAEAVCEAERGMNGVFTERKRRKQLKHHKYWFIRQCWWKNKEVKAGFIYQWPCNAHTQTHIQSCICLVSVRQQLQLASRLKLMQDLGHYCGQMQKEKVSWAFRKSLIMTNNTKCIMLRYEAQKPTEGTIELLIKIYADATSLTWNAKHEMVNRREESRKHTNSPKVAKRELHVWGMIMYIYV